MIHQKLLDSPNPSHLIGTLRDELPLVAVEHDVEEALRVERRPADEERHHDGR